jgi:TetR/AcrR family transcriptional regulator, cholesterol catabolism regulator
VHMGGRGSRAAAAHVVTLRQRFTPAQVERRARIRAAARVLASAGGYAAVTIDDVAARAGVARATVYRYFASKDHLLSEVSVEWGAEIVAGLRARPPRPAAAAERVAEVFGRVIEVASKDMNLAAAVIAAATSPDPAVDPRELASVIFGYLDSAIGDDDVGDREALGTVLGHVLLSTLIQLTGGRATPERAADDLRAAARLLLPA